MAPSLAFGWQIWTRHRLGLSLCAGYGLLLAVGARVLPVRSLSSEWILLLFAGPCAGGFGYLVAVLSIGLDAHIEKRESGFPRRMWTLPLSTWSLVAWPMAWGTSVLALAWLILPWSVLASPDIDLTLLIWVPALVLPAALAWLQALVWSPMPLPGLRLFLIGPLLSAALIGPQMLLVNVNVHPSLGYASLAIQLPIAYLTAVYGVSRARRGDVLHWEWPGWPTWLRWTSARTLGQPFASPAQAQRWFEWRRHRLAFPLSLGGTALWWCPLVPGFAEFLDTAEGGGNPIMPSALLHEIGGLWLAAATLLLAPPMMAWVIGSEMGRLPGRDRRRVLSSFLATRPASAVFFVGAKLQMAAFTTLVGWGVFLLVILFWFSLGGKAAEMTATLDALRQRHPESPILLWLVLLLVGSILLTWLQMVQGLWLGLLPDPWRLVALLLILGSLVALSPLVVWGIRSVQHSPSVSEVLPWLAGGAVLLKCLLALWSVRALKRRNLVSPGFLGKTLAVWSLFVAGLFGVMHGLLPDGGTSVSILVLGIALLVPLTRLALAPLALDWNRHR